jgi:hypothetical protein
MTRLDDYRSALHVGFSEVPDEDLIRTLEEGGPGFASFIIDHGLGPLWHERTGRAEFRESRLAAEAHYAAQEHALHNIDAVLCAAGIDYAVIKGAANRLFLYDNPAVRACHDLDLLVRADDRIRAATTLVKAGYKASPDEQSISRELVLSHGGVDIDLHWGLLREGRLRSNPVDQILDCRRRVSGLWMLNSDDALFMLLVHPAFAKHLAGWDMGLHRVLDIIVWLRTQSVDWPVVRRRLQEDGVRTAAWATLRWAALLTAPHSLDGLNAMLSDLQPGRLRAAWIGRWLQDDLSARMSHAHWARLLGFSLFLHDAPGDSVRAFLGRRQAHRRRHADIAAFQELLGQ